MSIVDLLVIVVLDLHDLVAGRKGPAKSLDLTIARRIQCGLQFDVDGACSNAAAVHRAENVDIADWIETEAALDAGLPRRCSWTLSLCNGEGAIAVSRLAAGEIRNAPFRHRLDAFLEIVGLA